MLSRIVTSALFAGFAAGLIAALLQLAFVQPHLLHAEMFESGELVHSVTAGSSAHGPAYQFDGDARWVEHFVFGADLHRLCLDDDCGDGICG